METITVYVCESQPIVIEGLKRALEGQGDLQLVGASLSIADALESIAAVQPNIILLDAQEPDGFVRDWQPPGLPPERHSAYALTWFALALTLLVLYVRLALRPAP